VRCAAGHVPGPHIPGGGRLLAKLVIEADHPADLGGAALQRRGDGLNGTVGDIPQCALNGVQNRQQGARALAVLLDRALDRAQWRGMDLSLAAVRRRYGLESGHQPSHRDDGSRV